MKPPSLEALCTAKAFYDKWVTYQKDWENLPPYTSLSPKEQAFWEELSAFVLGCLEDNRSTYIEELEQVLRRALDEIY